LGARGLEPTAADLKDIPVLTTEELRRMYRPVKAPVTVRIDGDILAWLKSKGGQYQTHMNATLRDAMLSEVRVPNKSGKKSASKYPLRDRAVSFDTQLITGQHSVIAVAEGGKKK
jgi:hypothetical protein